MSIAKSEQTVTNMMEAVAERLTVCGIPSKATDKTVLMYAEALIIDLANFFPEVQEYLEDRVRIIQTDIENIKAKLTEEA